jgi:RHS repeat-associated protein
VHVWAYHNFGNGTPQYMLGVSTYGDARSDVAASRGARFLNSGYHFTVTGQPAGWYRFVVSSHSWPSGAWTGRTVDAYVDIPTVSLQINRSGTGTGSIVATGLSCPGGSTTQAMPCGASYALNTVVTITAVPDPGSTFAGWGGGCLGTQPSCGVTLAGDRFAFAYFTKTPDTVATTYYHTDAIGSVRALSDDTGATVIRHDYLPFGEDTQPLTGDPMRFAGKELDPESALMNFEARYYRNTWGRFTQVDPVPGSLTDPQRWNRYAYAGNNPLRFTDNSGLSYEGAWVEQSGTYFHQQPFYFALDNNFFSWLAANHWHIYNCATCDGEIVDDATGNHVGIYSYFPSPDASHPPPGGGDSGSGSGSDGGGGSAPPPPPPLPPQPPLPPMPPNDCGPTLPDCVPNEPPPPRPPLLQRDNGVTIPNVPPGWSFCKDYRDDGSGAGEVLYHLCNGFPDNPWSNCTRGLLLDQYVKGGNPAELSMYLVVDHLKDFAYCAGAVYLNRR